MRHGKQQVGRLEMGRTLEEGQMRDEKRCVDSRSLGLKDLWKETKGGYKELAFRSRARQDGVTAVGIAATTWNHNGGGARLQSSADGYAIAEEKHS